MAGLTSKPPKAKAQYTRQERKAFNSGKVADPRAGKNQAPGAPTYEGLNADQAGVINNVNRSDLGLSDFNNQQLGGVYGAYNQPFDQSQLPQSPWEQGQTIEGMNTEYYDKALSNYDRSMADQYKQQDADFEQQMYNRGIPLGSELYNKLKAETAKTRDSSRQNAMDSAYFNAGQNATTWNNLATNNFNNAYGFQQDMRNMPASEFAKIQALQSGFGGQNLGYTQAGGLAAQQQGYNKENAAQAQKYAMQQIGASRSGGGGGGGGSGALWQQYGFASPQEYDAYKTNQQRDQYLWTQANQPQAPDQPSPWASGLGQIAGIGFGSYLGSLW